MRLLSNKTLDDCLGGSTYLELSFDVEFTEPVVLGLKAYGELQYFPEFARPYFQFKGTERYILKGVLGENSCKLITPTNSQAECLQIVESVLRKISNH